MEMLCQCQVASAQKLFVQTIGSWQVVQEDSPSQDLQKLRNSVVSLLLVNELEEDVVDWAADERTQVQELAINAMKRRFQKVALTRILTVEQLQQLTMTKFENQISRMPNSWIGIQLPEEDRNIVPEG